VSFSPQCEVPEGLFGGGDGATEEIEAATELRAAVDLRCGGACGGEEGVRAWESEGAAAGALGSVL
jgi:hypothetical protein